MSPSSGPDPVSRLVVVGTRNRKKLGELKDLLSGLPVYLKTLDAFPHAPEVVEDAPTFLGNARKKAVELARALDCWVVADDSGLCVDALDGAPGVWSARYAGPEATDEQNNAKLREQLAHVPEAQRSAHFMCTVVLAAPDQILLEAQGRCDGLIAFENRGSNGFGYDPLFIAPEYGRTFAELGAEIKNRISHRAHALRNLRQGLVGLLGEPGQ
jgi:XTP/dITP diphosphohydrolase